MSNCSELQLIGKLLAWGGNFSKCFLMWLVLVSAVFLLLEVNLLRKIVTGMGTDNLPLRRTEAEITRSCYVFIACIFVCTPLAQLQQDANGLPACELVKALHVVWISEQ